jgi:hypothetical protein
MNTPASGSARRRAVQTVLLRAAVAVAALAALWLVLTIHPKPLFAHTLRRANVVLHARVPFPPQATSMLDEVVRRVARLPLYDPERTQNVYLCDTPLLFAFFVPYARKVGGVANLTGNVFIRPANLARNRVVGPSGDEKGGERTLTYFIAHEVTHMMTMARTGPIPYHRLAAFQTEGYADYVAFDHHVDLAAGRAALRAGVAEMDPRRSGLYRRHELLVAYLLDRVGLSVNELLAAPLDRTDVEERLENDRGL